MTVEVVAISLLLAISMGMGMFSVTQLGYQNRVGGIKMFGMSIYAFLKGFTAWPVLFPIGLKRGKYKMNVYHKVGKTDIK